jgi:hypothetical protein
MLPPIDEARRTSLMRIATMLVLGSAAVLPLTAQGSHAGRADAFVPGRTQAVPAAPQPLRFPRYVFRRDPFVRTAGVAEKPSIGQGPVQGQAAELGVALPPNAGAAQDAGSSVDVRAVVLGPHAKALIESGGSITVVGVGDRLAGVRVTAITAGGVQFADGTMLTLRRER